MEEDNIYGVYFVCCVNHYLQVVEEQLQSLDKGLLNVTKNLIIFITKYDENDIKLKDIIARFNTSNKILLVTTSENLYEKFAINNYKKYIPDKNYYVYYFHTKGVTRSLGDNYQSARKLLNFYTLEKYYINTNLLKRYDAIGCSLALYPKKHFSGNFWWSKSSHVNTLSNVNDNYLAPEMYILSRDDCKYISLANDTNRIILDENYKFKTDTDILRNLTQDMHINENDLYYLKHC